MFGSVRSAGRVLVFHRPGCVPALRLSPKPFPGRRIREPPSHRTGHHAGQGDHHPGDRQIRALFVSAGNPVLSVPNGAELAEAMPQLELSVALDFYLTETTAQCDYVLPVTTMYERDDFPLLFQAFQATPFRQTTDAVVPAQGPGAHRVGHRRRPDAPDGHPVPGVRGPGRDRLSAGLLGRRLNPRFLVDTIIRIGRGGDWFGLRRGGLSFRSLDGRPSARRGVWNRSCAPASSATPWLTRVGGYDCGTMRSPTRLSELTARPEPIGYPLQLIGMREARSENSWMHNAPLADAR